MSNETEPQFSPEDTAEHLRGLQASADLIDALIAANDRSAEQRDTMDRNVRHIGIMCAMPHLQECGADLTPYTDAAHRGAAWLA
jgi:hypothetical protein